MVDVLVGIHGGVEAKFFFAPENGRLLAIEMFPDSDVDPCEVYWRDYDEIDGRFLPRRCEVRHGDDLYGVMEMSNYEFVEAEN